MNINYKFKELFELFEIELLNKNDVLSCPQYSEISNISNDILSFFGLPSVNIILRDFLQFAYGTDYTEASVTRIIEVLTEVATQYLAEPSTSSPNVSDIFKRVVTGFTGDNTHETENNKEEDDNILAQSLDSAWQAIRAKRDWENHLKSTGGKSTPIESENVKDYVIKHLYLPLTDQEFSNIETGFCLRWNYSYGQMVGDGDLKRAVDQYLVSIESPMDRGKMKKVVDLILEYLEEIGEWGNQ